MTRTIAYIALFAGLTGATATSAVAQTTGTGNANETTVSPTNRQSFPLHQGNNNGSSSGNTNDADARSGSSANSGSNSGADSTSGAVSGSDSTSGAVSGSDSTSGAVSGSDSTSGSNSGADSTSGATGGNSGATGGTGGNSGASINTHEVTEAPGFGHSIGWGLGEIFGSEPLPNNVGIPGQTVVNPNTGQCASSDGVETNSFSIGGLFQSSGTTTVDNNDCEGVANAVSGLMFAQFASMTPKQLVFSISGMQPEFQQQVVLAHLSARGYHRVVEMLRKVPADQWVHLHAEIVGRLISIEESFNNNGANPSEEELIDALEIE